MDHSGKFANGALHWLAFTDFSSGCAIVALDLSNETCREVLQPSYGEGDFDLKLGVLGELVCVLCNYYGTRGQLARLGLVLVEFLPNYCWYMNTPDDQLQEE